MRIGIDLGGTKIEIIALDDDGVEKLRRRIPTPRSGYRDVLGAVRDLVAWADGALGSGPGTAPPLGVAIPGALSTANGRVKNANSTWLNGRPFDRDLAEATDRPLRVANDANCFTLSEATDGAGAGKAVVFGVILGTGVGGGIAVEGRLLTGANAIAGEWGHSPLPWPGDAERPGPSCYCGRHGCVETFLSGPGLSRDHGVHGKDAPGRPPDPQTLAAEALAEPAGEAAATLRRYEHRLARALANVINILDPDIIVLGGGLSNITALYDAVPALWPGLVFSDRIDTALVPAAHGDSSGVRGAAWLWPADTRP